MEHLSHDLFWMWICFVMKKKKITGERRGVKGHHWGVPQSQVSWSTFLQRRASREKQEADLSLPPQLESEAGPSLWSGTLNQGPLAWVRLIKIDQCHQRAFKSTDCKSGTVLITLNLNTAACIVLGSTSNSFV